MAEATSTKLSSSEYALRRKALLALVKQLRAVGAQGDLDLPRIVVIGNQSAGKSSVVEAISGITVPRDAGTCTRCPMECRLTSSDVPWTCQVSIRREFDAAGKRLDEVFETPFGKVITDKAEVEPALRRAQTAVLNPHIAIETVLKMTDEELKQRSAKTLPFSRNIVCVDLEGPDLTDLSFIDLPGLIQNAEPDVVQLVEDMVVSHIQGNCLILVALPMTDDIENQKALRLAHKEDPQGLRTIGVLTKPDMLSQGSIKARDLWLDVIEGRRHQLKHGYFCTRQPDDADRTNGITSVRARMAETEFFAKTTPWSTSTHQARFGTSNLVDTLSAQLIQIINDTLPRVRAEAAAHLDACAAELALLPRAVELPPATHMLSLITRFVDAAQRHVRGRSHGGALVHRNRAAFGRLKRAVRGSAPCFVAAVDAGDARGRGEFANYLGEGEDEGAEGAVSGGTPCYLSDVRKHVERSITRELPNNVPFEAKASLIVAFQATWPSAVSTCFENVRATLLEFLIESVEETFKRYDRLQKIMKTLVTELISSHFDSCFLLLNAVLEAEETPFTQNDHYLSSCTEKWLGKYRDYRAGNTGPQNADQPAKRQRLDASAKPAAPVPSMSFSFSNPPATSKATSATASATPATPVSATPAPAPAAPKPVPAAPKPSPAPTLSAPVLSAGAFSNPFGQSSGTSSTAMGIFGKPAPASSSAFSAFTTATGNSTFFNPTPAASSQVTVNPPAAKRANFGDSSARAATPAPITPTAPTRALTPSRPSPGPMSAFDISASAAASEHAMDSFRLNTALAALAALGYTGLTAEDLGKLNPPDQYATELQVMAEVRAYFQVAYKRVIDVVPALVDQHFVKAVARALQTFLIEKLALGTPEGTARCAGFLAEDPAVVARRDELIARKKRLESVGTELYNFGL